MNRVPREDAEPLEFGKLLHVIFEENARGMNMKRAIAKHGHDWYLKSQSSTSPMEAAFSAKIFKQLEDISEALVQWKDQYDFEIPVLETEEPFEIRHPSVPSVAIIGRPDRVAVMQGKLWHIQNRGLNQNTNFGVYIDLAKRHYHEHVYAEALSAKYPDYEYGGTVFNLVRKLKYRTGVTKKNPEGVVKALSELLYQQPMSINLKSDLHIDIMECVAVYALRMKEAEDLWEHKGIIPPPNEDMNGGYWRNKPDLYFRVLTGEITLDDDRYFKDRVDPYSSTLPVE
jgi:hypothetical protein